jgi:aspartyl-tRNA(Asn)/glutamyl-tRNA(Gln) amidotransferase subunit C
MITKKELQHLSKLSKLNLSEDELKDLAPQLDNILKLVSQLNEVKTDKVKETNQTTGLENIYRQDEVIPSEEEKELIQCSPNKVENNSIVVPRIL